MNSTFRPGDRVEVDLILASRGALRDPLRHWASGYVVVRTEGRWVIVCRTAGLFAGVEIRYDERDVRRDNSHGAFQLDE